MDAKLINDIIKATPRVFKCKCEVSPLWTVEGLESWVAKVNPPDRKIICESVGFLRYVKVGEFDDKWDVIILYPEHYDRLLPVFKNALAKIGHSEIPVLKLREPPSELDYEDRVLSDQQ